MSLAKINGLFRLTRDAEIINTQSGSMITKLGLVCSEKYKDKETQLFLDAVAFGKTGEIISQYAGNKGTQIFLSGKLQTETWQDSQTGQNRSKVSMTIESFDFVSKAQTNNTQANKAPQQSHNQQQQQSYQAPQQSYNQQPQQQSHTDYREPQRPMPDKNSLPNIDIDEDSIPF